MNLAEILAKADEMTQGVEVDTNTDYTPIEPGVYEVVVSAVKNAVDEGGNDIIGPDGLPVDVIDSRSVNPKNPAEHGKYISLVLDVTSEKRRGRKLFMRNNIIVYPKDDSAESIRKAQLAMAIGAKERKVMLDSIGKTGIERASDLIGASFKVNVIIRPAEGQYKARNEIKSLSPLGGGNAAKGAPASNPAAPAANPSRKKMPWEKD